MTDTQPKGDQTTASKPTDKGQDWLTHLQQCQAPGQSMAAYARSQGLGLKSFYRWRHQLLSSPADEMLGTAPLFHPVRMTGLASPTGSDVSTLFRTQG
jgi:hypothetical protein